jgi:hypothetical protein
MESTGTLASTKRVLETLEEDIEMEINDLEKATGESNPMLRLLLFQLSVKAM